MVRNKMNMNSATWFRWTALAGWLALAGCASAPPTFDLSSAPRIGPLKTLTISLVVAEPKAPQALDNEHMIVRDASGAISYVPGSQWSERVPALLQARLVRAIEAKGYAVSREGSGVIGDRVLASEISAFNLVPGSPTRVELSMTLRLIDAKEGRLLASRSFQAEAGIDRLAGETIAAGFDAALSSLLPIVAEWALTVH